MSISKSIPTPTAQEDNRVGKETCTVYTVACDDSNGTRAQVFCRWLAENAEAPDENARAELLQLAHAREDDAFWQLLEQSREDFAACRVESHDLQLQPNLF
jgi:hypothetical protein